MAVSGAFAAVMLVGLVGLVGLGLPHYWQRCFLEFFWLEIESVW